eukprot:COSAG01_NODE_7475_length_3195_cov_5.249031_2_plen_106_part_00
MAMPPPAAAASPARRLRLACDAAMHAAAGGWRLPCTGWLLWLWLARPRAERLRARIGLWGRASLTSAVLSDRQSEHFFYFGFHEYDGMRRSSECAGRNDLSELVE